MSTALGRNVVVSVSTGYPRSYYQLFVGSLRAHYSGPIVLFDARERQDVDAYCRDQRVELHRRESAARFGLNDSSTMRLLFTRFVFYSRVCSARSARSGMCFACDFRDTFFQANPFAAAAVRHQPDLALFEEGLGTLFESTINKNWLRACYGDAELSRIGGRRTINAGAVFGSAAGLAALADIFAGAWQLASRGIRFRFRVQCTDQGVLNHAVLTRAPRLRGLSVDVQPLGRGLVRTMYSLKQARPEAVARLLSRSGAVLNDDGAPCATVHMWDRVRVRFWCNFSVLRRHNPRVLECGLHRPRLPHHYFQGACATTSTGAVRMC